MIWVLVVVGALVALVLVLAALKPSTFRVTRSAEMAAAPEAIFPHLEDLRRWQAWSPWEGLDPEMKRTYGGAERGVGATYAWDGNRKAGAGRMEIVEATAPKALQIALTFTRPFKSTNRTDFELAEAAEGTRVSWTMSGPSGFGMRVFEVFVPMNKLVGRDFDRGLAKLRGVVEGA